MKMFFKEYNYYIAYCATTKDRRSCFGSIEIRKGNKFKIYNYKDIKNLETQLIKILK